MIRTEKVGTIQIMHTGAIEVAGTSVAPQHMHQPVAKNGAKVPKKVAFAIVVILTA